MATLDAQMKFYQNQQKRGRTMRTSLPELVQKERARSFYEASKASHTKALGPTQWFPATEGQSRGGSGGPKFARRQPIWEVGKRHREQAFAQYELMRLAPPGRPRVTTYIKSTPLEIEYAQGAAEARLEGARFYKGGGTFTYTGLPGNLPHAIGNVPQVEGLTAERAAQVYERTYKETLTINTPTGLKSATTREVLGKDFSQYAELMARKSAMDNLPVGQVKEHVKSKFRSQWWKKNLKEVFLKTGDNADLARLPQEIRPYMERITKLANQSGWQVKQGQYRLRGYDDTINTMTLIKEGRKAIQVPVPTMKGTYAFTKTKNGVFGEILQGYMPSGEERLPYLQAQANMLVKESELKGTEFGRSWERVSEKMQPARMKADFSLYDVPRFAGTYSEDLHEEVLKTQGLMTSKDRALTPKEGFKHLSDVYEKHVIPGKYSTAFQNPKQLLEQGKLSDIMPRDVPFGSALSPVKPTYYRYGVAPLVEKMWKGTHKPPILGVETARARREFLPRMPGYNKGMIHERYVRALVLTEPAMAQQFIGSPESVVMSNELYSRIHAKGIPLEKGMTLTTAGKKASIGARVSRATMGNVDIIMSQEMAANELYRTWVGHGAYQAQAKGGSEGLRSYLKRVGDFDKTSSFEAVSKLPGDRAYGVNVDVSDAFDYEGFAPHLKKVHKDMGLVTPMQDVPGVGFETWIPVSRRALKEPVVEHGSKFRPNIEWRHLQMQGQGELAEILMKKATAGHQAMPGVVKALMPFAGRGEELGELARMGDTLVQAKDLEDLSWALDTGLTARQAHRAETPFFKSAYEKGFTIQLPNPIDVPVGMGAEISTGVREGISTRTSFLHIAEFKAHRESLGILMHSDVVSGIPLTAEAEIHMDPLLKAAFEVSEASRALGTTYSREGEVLVAEKAKAYAELYAERSGKDSFIRSLAEPRLEHSAYLGIRTAPMEGTGVPLLEAVAKEYKKRGGIAPGPGEIVVGKRRMKELGLWDLHKAGKPTHAFLQAYPGLGPGTTTPVKVLYGKGVEEGTMLLHLQELIGTMRDTDRDSLSVFSDPSKEAQTNLRKWYMDSSKEKAVIYDMLTDHTKKTSKGVQTAAQVITNMSKATGQSPETVMGVVQSLYATKALTGNVNSALAPYRTIALDVFSRESKENLTIATMDALAMLEQTAIQKGEGTGLGALQYLQSVISSENESGVVEELSKRLRQTAEVVVDKGWKATHGSEPGKFIGREGAAYATQAAHGLRTLQLAHLEPEYRGVMSFINKVFGRGKGRQITAMELVDTMASDAPATAVQQTIRRVMGMPEAGPLLARKESAMISDLNAVVGERGVKNAAKPLWASVKHLWGSLPAWGKVAAVGMGVLGGAAMVRGVMGGSLDAPAMTIPPEVLMKELYGSQGGSPVPPAMIDVPQHQQYTPTRMMDMKPPARLRMDNRQYDIRLHGMDDGYGDPSNMPAELDKLLQQHAGVSPTTNIRIDGPNVRDTRSAAMRRFSDISESRFYG